MCLPVPARLAIALLAALPGAAAAQGLPPPAEAVAALPHALPGFSRTGEVTDYEQRQGGAGLGASTEYRATAGTAIATVYIYDRGRKDLPNGADNPSVEAELRSAAREIEAAAPRRNYRIESRTPTVAIPGPDGLPALRCDRFDLAFDNGTHREGFACVGVVARRFLKLRVTLAATGPGGSEGRVAVFGAAVVAAVTEQ